MGLVLVKHTCTPMGSGGISGAYKADRPVYVMSIPPAGYKWQVQSKVPAVLRARFDGNFLPQLPRDRTQRAFVIAGFVSSGGRAVRICNSMRYLEPPCRLCKAISQKDVGEEAGHALFRLLFAQTGWMLLEPGMTKATEGSPSFVQRSADGRTIPHQRVSGISRILVTMPGEGSEGLVRDHGHLKNESYEDR